MLKKEKTSKYLKSNRAGLITLLTISSFFAILVATVPLQAANAQLNPTTVQSLLKTGYTNQYQLKTANAGVLTVLYSIRGGVLVGILGNPAMKAGDIVTTIGSVAIMSEATYKTAMETYKPDETVKVTYIRNGNQKQRKVTLSKLTVYKKAGTK